MRYFSAFGSFVKRTTTQSYSTAPQQTKSPVNSTTITCTTIGDRRHSDIAASFLQHGCATIPASVTRPVIIVGGGIAGLAASIYRARAGRSVTIFERRRNLGGRAITHLRKGFRFNLGPHAVYRGGASASVYRDLGIPIRGGMPKTKGYAFHEGTRYGLPAGFLSVFTTGLLSVKAKASAAAFFVRLRRLDPKKFADITVREWLDRSFTDERLRQTIEAFIRLATYSDA